MLRCAGVRGILETPSCVGGEGGCRGMILADWPLGARHLEEKHSASDFCSRRRASAWSGRSRTCLSACQAVSYGVVRHRMSAEKILLTSACRGAERERAPDRMAGGSQGIVVQGRVCVISRGLSRHSAHRRFNRWNGTRTVRELHMELLLTSELDAVEMVAPRRTRRRPRHPQSGRSVERSASPT